ncbi:MAG: DUF2283 domain-containing protein, partial [Calditrichaeota bacterium]|nr:DUF2283 domain-containing protein [Calditrichota bacterium]
MAVKGLKDIIRLVPMVQRSPQSLLWMTYDREADVLYVNFRKPSVADDSELSDDDVILRYAEKELIGYTVL